MDWLYLYVHCFWLVGFRSFLTANHLYWLSPVLRLFRSSLSIWGTFSASSSSRPVPTPARFFPFLVFQAGIIVSLWQLRYRNYHILERPALKCSLVKQR